MNGAPLVRFGEPIPPRQFEGVVRTMALAHQKWDAQVGDVAALAPFPLVLSRPVWERLASLAEALARETEAVEDELRCRPELHRRLGLPSLLSRALETGSTFSRSPSAPRILRFDFHPTDDGWRASEVNSDAPGGFTESSRFAQMVAELSGCGNVPGDAGEAWLKSVLAAVPRSGRGVTVLLSAPGWLEDIQVVAHLAARLRSHGVRAVLASPHHLRWFEGKPRLETEFHDGPVEAILRFYQAEWIVRLPCREAWWPLFGGSRVPVSNPGSAALTESKRVPVVWTDLDASTAHYRDAMPEAVDPRAARGLWSGDWVLKPAFGNTGDDVALREGMPRSEWRRRVLFALARPSRWIAQRRFRSLAIESPQGPLHACVGVYVVSGRAAGAYGRVSPSRVIDYRAMDTAVLIEE